MDGAGQQIEPGQKGAVRRALGGWGVAYLSALSALLVTLSPASSAGAAPIKAVPGQIAEFQLPAGSSPEGITAGPEGNLWFTEWGTNKIGRITPSGQITEFALPSASTHPTSITAAPEGDLWFTEASGKDKIGRITPAGEVIGFAVPVGEEPEQIVAGPEGDLWFTAAQDEGGGEIGRITPSGQITAFPIYSEGAPSAITVAPEGDLWFTERYLLHPSGGAFEIGRATPSGQLSEYTVAQRPYGITAGPEGDLWFTELYAECSCEGEQEDGSKIGRITPSGQITEFALPSGESDPYAITTGPDGNLWFFGSDGPTRRGWQAGSGPSASQIGRMSPSGLHHVTEFLTESFPRHSASAGQPFSGAISAGPEGELWFTEPWTDRVGHITPGPPGRLTIEVTGYHASARHGWVKLQLACVGGGIESPCIGGLNLSIGTADPRIKKLELDQRPYTVPSEMTQQIRLRLTHSALSLLARHPQLRMVASVTSTGGERASDETFLPRALR